MENEIVKAVRITQVLIDNGWKFIDNGYNEVKKVSNGIADEDVSFNDHAEFIEWLFNQEERYL